MTDKKEQPYFPRRAVGRLGYEIIKRENWTSVYETPDSEQAKEACKILVENNGDITKLPTPSNKWPVMILVFNEKHGDRHYVVRTNADLEKIALDIVLERKEQGWYYKPEKKEFGKLLTKEEIEALPTESLQAAAKKEMRELVSNIKYYKEEWENWNLLERVVEKQSGELALSFLDSRRDGEYERYEIIDPCNDEPMY